MLREAGVPVVLEPSIRREAAWTRTRWALLRRLASQRRPNWLITNDPKLYWPLIFVGRLSGARTALFRHWEYMYKGALSRRVPRLADRFILVSRCQREPCVPTGST